MSGWKVRIPVICEETGYYGGELAVLGPSREHALEALEDRIAIGLIGRKSAVRQTAVARDVARD